MRRGGAAPHSRHRYGERAPLRAARAAALRCPQLRAVPESLIFTFKTFVCLNQELLAEILI